jgi:proline dehydrogenase
MPLLRAVLIALSRSGVAKSVVIRTPGIRGATRRFVAGETLAEALGAIRELNAAGCLATLDPLGENTAAEAEARTAAAEALRALEGISRGALKANVSIKLTQMGLDLGERLCESVAGELLEKASGLGNFVRVDMEGSAYTERTVRIFERLRERFDNVGIVLQAYLRRTQDDIRWIAAKGYNVRLCKGAYLEPETVAFLTMEEVNRNYLACAEILLSDESLAKGTKPCFATHDPAMVDGVKDIVRKHGVAPGRFEMQMLYGIRRDLQQQLAREGFTVRIYVPYGPQWYPYFMRRLAERPANVGFILRNAFRR